MAGIIQVQNTTSSIPTSPHFPLPYSFFSPFPQRSYFQIPSESNSLSPKAFLSVSKPNQSLSSPSSSCFPSQSLLPNSKTIFSPNSRDTLFNLLRLSTRYNDTELARAVHARILKLEEDIYLDNSLIAAYVKLGLVSDAYKVFLILSCPNVVSHTMLISEFSKSNREVEAIELFLKLWRSDIEPNEYTFVAILTACIRNTSLQLAFQIHATVIKMGYLNCVFVSNALMGVYSKCGYLNFVLKLFFELPKRDITSWNTVIASVVKELMYDEAFGFFRDMQQNDAFKVDHFTISTLLTACTGNVSSMKGRQVHAHAIKVGLETHLSVSNALIGFYSKCGSINHVWKLFERMPVRDVITWTELITSYMECGLLDMAVEIFNKMPERNCISFNALLAGFCKNTEGSRALGFFVEMLEEGVELSEFTLTSVVNACGLLRDFAVSKQIQGFVIKFGIRSNVCVETALLDMCMKCGRTEDAERMLQQRPFNEDNSTMLTSMICGYARNGQHDEAISLFHISQKEGAIIMDEVASTTLLGLCGSIGFHEMGKQIHCHALKSGFLSDLRVENAVVSMYAKCWNMKDAIKIFDSMTFHDIVSWNSLIAGHLLHRQGDEALAIWKIMEKIGIKPDDLTFVLIISAYRHTELNLVDNCRSLFLSMRSVYDIKPTSEHYASFVSVLGRWGLLGEAEEMIRNMPFKPEVCVWRALLHSCRIHSNTVIGKQVAKHILASEPKNPSTYILVSNLYSASGRWYCSDMVRKDMREKGFRKHPARSWIVHENKIHSFFARDKSHPQSKDICRGLEILSLECLKAGYVPDTSFVLHEVEEHQKRDFLFYHSAKLAATYGILTNKPGKPIKIVKNILLCGDCHTFLKYVSIVTKRLILLRDTSGFHCFSNGECSCKGYW